MTRLLEVSGLHAHYGESHVLHGIDLAINDGEAVGLLGRNGMGKTTTLRALFGLTPPSAGTVRVRGHDCAGQPPQRIARRGLALVPEGRGVFPNLSVRENLIMAARPGVDGCSDWTLKRVLSLFPRLGERLEHGGAQLSGGEQQMLAIGRALMTNPNLLVLDEATEGLAPMVREAIWTILATLRHESIAIVVVDKDLPALLDICARFVILEKGTVAWQGSAEALAAAPEIQKTLLGV